MPKFFFNVRSAEGFEPDRDGVELSDLSRVHWEAEQGARTLLAAGGEGTFELDHQRFEVTDEAGKVVLVYFFKQAIKHL